METQLCVGKNGRFLEDTLAMFGAAIITPDTLYLTNGAFPTDIASRIIDAHSERIAQAQCARIPEILTMDPAVVHSQELWDIRQNPDIVGLFSQVYNTPKQELYTTFSGLSVADTFGYTIGPRPFGKRREVYWRERPFYSPHAIEMQRMYIEPRGNIKAQYFINGISANAAYYPRIITNSHTTGVRISCSVAEPFVSESSNNNKLPILSDDTIRLVLSDGVCQVIDLVEFPPGTILLYYDMSIVGLGRNTGDNAILPVIWADLCYVPTAFDTTLDHMLSVFVRNAFYRRESISMVQPPTSNVGIIRSNHKHRNTSTSPVLSPLGEALAGIYPTQLPIGYTNKPPVFDETAEYIYPIHRTMAVERVTPLPEYFPDAEYTLC